MTPGGWRVTPWDCLPSCKRSPDIVLLLVYLRLTLTLNLTHVPQCVSHLDNSYYASVVGSHGQAIYPSIFTVAVFTNCQFNLESPQAAAVALFVWHVWQQSILYNSLFISLDSRDPVVYQLALTWKAHKPLSCSPTITYHPEVRYSLPLG